jgi:transaldolase
MANATQRLHDAGQSLWLDHITRDCSRAAHWRATSAIYRSRPDIEPHDLRPRDPRGQRIRRRDPRGTARGRSGEDLFFDLALEDLTRAADLLRPIHEATHRVDGWVSLEVSPKLADDTASTVARGEGSARARRASESLHQDPGYTGRCPAIEECIFAGVPINVTLLFSRAHYLAAAEAYIRGIERRVRREWIRSCRRWRRCS